MDIRKAQIADEFVVLDGQQRASRVAVNEGMYAALDRDFNQFRQCSLVAQYEFSGPWNSWEIHPAGDETVILLSGSATFPLLTGDGQQQVALATAGDYVLIPQGIWHTATTSEATRLLFITPGENTRHHQGAEPPAL